MHAHLLFCLNNAPSITSQTLVHHIHLNPSSRHPQPATITAAHTSVQAHLSSKACLWISIHTRHQQWNLTHFYRHRSDIKQYHRSGGGIITLTPVEKDQQQPQGMHKNLENKNTGTDHIDSGVNAKTYEKFLKMVQKYSQLEPSTDIYDTIDNTDMSRGKPNQFAYSNDHNPDRNADSINVYIRCNHSHSTDRTRSALLSSSSSSSSSSASISSSAASAADRASFIHTKNRKIVKRRMPSTEYSFATEKLALANAARVGDVRATKVIMHTIIKQGYQDYTRAYTILIHAYRKTRNPLACHNILQHMRAKSIPIGRVACRDSVRASIDCYDVSMLFEILFFFHENNIPSDLSAWLQAIQFCFKQSRTETAIHLFKMFVQYPHLKSSLLLKACTYLLEALEPLGRSKDAIDILSKLMNNNAPHDSPLRIWFDTYVARKVQHFQDKDAAVSDILREDKTITLLSEANLIVDSGDEASPSVSSFAQVLTNVTSTHQSPKSQKSDKKCTSSNNNIIVHTNFDDSNNNHLASLQNDPSFKQLKSELSSASKRGDIRSARMAFHQLLARSPDKKFETKIYTNLLHAYRKNSDSRGCYKVLLEMEKNNVAANKVTCRDSVRACVECRDVNTVIDILLFMNRTQVRSDPSAWAAALKLCFSTRRPQDAELLFREMCNSHYVRQDVRCFNTMIDGFGKLSDLKTAVIYFGMLLNSKTSAPDVVTYNSLIDATYRTAFTPVYYKFRVGSRAILKSMNRMKVGPDVFTATSFIRLYVRETYPLPTDSEGKRKERCIYLRYLWRIFYLRKNIKLDRKFFHALMDGFSQNYDVGNTNRALRAMINENIEPSVVSYSILLTASARCGDFNTCIATFSEMLSKGLEPDVFCFCSLVTACGNSGKQKRIPAILEQATSRGIRINAAIANAAITSCGTDLRLAAEVLRNLRASIKNLEILERQRITLSTYHALLRVCGKARDMSSSIQIIETMINEGFVIDRRCFDFFRKGIESGEDVEHGIFKLSELFNSQEIRKFKTLCGLDETSPLKSRTEPKYSSL